MRSGIRLHVVRAHTDEEIDAMFATLSKMKIGALVIGTDPFFHQQGGEARLDVAAIENTGDLPVPRIHRGRRRHELRRQHHGFSITTPGSMPAAS